VTIAASTDSVYLSLLTVTKEPIFYSETGDLLRIFIDSDNITKTGYFVPGMGADHMIEIYGQRSPANDNKTVYSSVLYIFDDDRDNNDWNGFVPLADIDVASKNDITECRVPLFDLGVQRMDSVKIAWQTSDSSGLTDLGEIIVGVNTEDIVISDVILNFQREGVAPSSDQLAIDGYFDDWKSIEKYLDNDWNEYQEGPEAVDNPNVDLMEYVSVNSGFNFFFYLSVHGDILSGTTVPEDSPKQLPSYSSNSNEIDVISPISDNKATEPELKADDTIYIFLDTYHSEVGFKVNDSFYADKLIEIKGQYGMVISSKLYNHSSADDSLWEWDYYREVDSAAPKTSKSPSLSISTARTHIAPSILSSIRTAVQLGSEAPSF
jgi:hypothetical protein